MNKSSLTPISKRGLEVTPKIRGGSGLGTWFTYGFRLLLWCVLLQNWLDIPEDHWSCITHLSARDIITRGPWATMLTWVNSYKSLIQQFRLCCYGNKSKWGICTTSLCLVKVYLTNIYKKVLSKYCSEISNKDILSLFLSMEQQKHMINGNKKRFVEANVMNISEKFQLHPPYGFWLDDFWILFCEFILWVAMATNQNQQFGQNYYVW